jgi:hypothetical protein
MNAVDTPPEVEKRILSFTMYQPGKEAPVPLEALLSYWDSGKLMFVFKGAGKYYHRLMAWSDSMPEKWFTIHREGGLVVLFPDLRRSVARVRYYSDPTVRLGEVSVLFQPIHAYAKEPKTDPHEIHVCLVDSDSGEEFSIGVLPVYHTQGAQMSEFFSEERGEGAYLEAIPTD